MGMMVYLVDEAEVKAVPGSNDTGSTRRLVRDARSQRTSLAWFDEELADVMEEVCPDFTHADALRDIFAGRVTRDRMRRSRKSTPSSMCAVRWGSGYKINSPGVVRV